MPIVAFGVEVPDGDPGALRSAAGSMDGSAGALESVASGLAGAVCSWSGRGSVAFANARETQQSAATRGAHAFGVAARVLRSLADDLEEAQKRCERMLDRAEDADRRGTRARQAAEQAEAHGRASRQSEAAARQRAALAEGAGLPSTGEREAAAFFGREAYRADVELQAQRRAAGRAQDDLLDAQDLARRAAERYEANARHAAAQLAGLADQAPVVRSIDGQPVAATGGPGRPPLVPPVIVTATPAARPADEDDHNPLSWFASKAEGSWNWLKKNYAAASSAGHGLLDGAGLIPGFGEPADIINGLWYGAEGNATDAAISFAGVVPVVGSVGTGARLGRRGMELADHGADAAKGGATFVKRRSWRESEAIVGRSLGDGWEAQRSFKAGGDAHWAQLGSTRPDFWNPVKKVAVEVKNFKIETARGRAGLARSIEKQYTKRLDALPEGSSQRFFVDTMGQNAPPRLERELTERIWRRQYGKKGAQQLIDDPSLAGTARFRDAFDSDLLETIN